MQPPAIAPPRERPTVVALYLPQYHPIPENDRFWGKGFTEWMNVAKARPLFRGHHQPNVPADLGFCDLRVPETRCAQADLARQYGVGAFCYYHYWFAGHRVLERPFNEVLASGQPDFPFCLCWANESWTGVWHGAPGRTLLEQTYPGDEDHERHFHAVLPAFLDKRYLRVDGKPVFVVFKPGRIPDVQRFIPLWQDLAIRNGLSGIHFVGFTWNWAWNPASTGFDAALPQIQIATRQLHEQKKDPNVPAVIRYEDVEPHCMPAQNPDWLVYPTVIPNWDNTPRSGERGVVFQGSTPELFRGQMRRAMALVKERPAEQRIVFVKAWNEWAEGNYLEPDLRFGHQYLEVIRQELRGE